MGNVVSVCKDCGHSHVLECDEYRTSSEPKCGDHAHHDGPVDLTRFKTRYKTVPHDTTRQEPVYENKATTIRVQKFRREYFDVEKEVDVFEPDTWRDEVVEVKKERDVVTESMEIRHRPVQVPYADYESRTEWYTDYSTGQYRSRTTSVPVTKYRSDTVNEYVRIPKTTKEYYTDRVTQRVKVPGKKIGTEMKKFTEFRDIPYFEDQVKWEKVQVGTKSVITHGFKNKLVTEKYTEVCSSCKCLKCVPKKCKCGTRFTSV